MTFYPVIGIETHVQLNTITKLFCGCLNEYAPDQPNKNICPFCTGQPGALPILNKSAVEKAIKFGLAIGSKIPNRTRWDRKNYFYPDLPAGYQISQYDNPIVEGGKIDFFIEDKTNGKYEPFSVELTRAHLEADAGKLLHVGGKTLVDFNRSGAPLIEIVTEPVMNNAAQAMAYVSELQLLVRKLGISNADMEKGQMRFDCNLSLQTEEENKNGSLPGYKVEIKNINSVRALGRAIEYEIKRQTELLKKDETPKQETRGWRDDLNKSESQRSKEQAQDYRYFPEPDLQILEIHQEDIQRLSDLPELPKDQRQRYLDIGLNIQTSNTLVNKDIVGTYFDSAIDSIENKTTELLKTIANIVTINIQSLVEEDTNDIEEIINSKKVVEIATLLSEKKINNQGLNKILNIVAKEKDKSIQEIVTENNLIQVTDDGALLEIVKVVIDNNPTQVNQYKEGKLQVIDYLLGQCMKEARGKGNPVKFRELLTEELS